MPLPLFPYMYLSNLDRVNGKQVEQKMEFFNLSSRHGTYINMARTRLLVLHMSGTSLERREWERRLGKFTTAKVCSEYLGKWRWRGNA